MQGSRWSEHRGGRPGAADRQASHPGAFGHPVDTLSEMPRGHDLPEAPDVGGDPRWRSRATARVSGNARFWIRVGEARREPLASQSGASRPIPSQWRIVPAGRSAGRRVADGHGAVIRRRHSASASRGNGTGGHRAAGRHRAGKAPPRLARAVASWGGRASSQSKGRGLTRGMSASVRRLIPRAITKRGGGARRDRHHVGDLDRDAGARARRDARIVGGENGRVAAPVAGEGDAASLRMRGRDPVALALGGRHAIAHEPSGNR